MKSVVFPRVSTQPSRPDRSAARLVNRRLAALLAVSCLGTSLASGAIILDESFESANPWPGNRVYSTTQLGATRSIVTGAGTVDSHMGNGGKGFRLNFNVPATQPGFWYVGGGSGVITNPNRHPYRAELNFGLDVVSSQVRPLRARLTSYDASWNRTGSIDFYFTPPVANAFKRYTFDLDQADVETPQTQSGGTVTYFDPTSPLIEVTIDIISSDSAQPWPAGAQSIQVDNVSFSVPSVWVNNSYNGSAGTSDGSYFRPFTTIQAAVDIAQPGDGIFVRPGNGPYVPANQWSNLVQIDKAGTPSKWIIIRNYPYEAAPVLTPGLYSYNTVFLTHKSAYVELRGLEVKGRRLDTANGINETNAIANAQNGANIVEKYNTNGISVDSRFLSPGGGNQPVAPWNAHAHHIRIIGNKIYDNTGGGIAVVESDQITIEGNTVYANSFYSRFATSGISLLNGWNYHWYDSFRNFILGNRVYDNECRVPYTGVSNQISDGNGIIIDRFDGSISSGNVGPYSGSVLVQNNLSYNNGGGGLQAYLAKRIYLSGNTVYNNVKSANLRAEGWSQIFLNQCSDIRMFNNIVYARDGAVISNVNGSTSGLYSGYNLYYRNNTAASSLPSSYFNGSANGTGGNPGANTNRWGDPYFINIGGANAANWNVNINSWSSAINNGLLQSFIPNATTIASGVPGMDFDGDFRPLGGQMDIGAYEY